MVETSTPPSKKLDFEQVVKSENFKLPAEKKDTENGELIKVFVRLKPVAEDNSKKNSQKSSNHKNYLNYHYILRRNKSGDDYFT